MKSKSDAELVQEIYDLIEGESVAKKRLIYIGLLGNAISISSTLVGISIINAAGFIALNSAGNSTQQAAFGLCISYYNMFVFALIASMQDKYGIDLSIHFGSEEHEKMKVVSTKMVTLVSSAFCF